MDPKLSPAIQELGRRGVIMPAPHTVYVDDAVLPERIAPGVVLFPGTRLMGDTISIGPNSEVGSETPMTLIDCQLGHGVSVKGGYANGCVFLDGAEMGSGAHLRPGTVLEEEAGGAHSVGLKQTVLLSYVVAGSLINFCDCLMAGGTSRKNHSEVGSSYIHFNFTPHGDKATPSLIGDVPRGVLLDQPPIFLGGQGGLVGPVQIEYGVTVAAGSILRKDALEPNCLYQAAGAKDSKPRAYARGHYRSIERLVHHNLSYIGNIRALQAWYQQVRIRTMRTDSFREACRQGALTQLDAIVKERIKRLQQVTEKLPQAIESWTAALGAEASQEPVGLRFQREWVRRWPRIQEHLIAPPPDAVGEEARDRFLSAWNQLEKTSHTAAVNQLSAEAKKAATKWLTAIVQHAASLESPQ